MTFLELCQKVAQESGTVSDLTSPSTVSGQSGRLLRIVNWTAQAYKDIQTGRDDWRWLRTEFEGTALANTQRYNASAMAISSRFNRWLFQTEDDDPAFSVQKVGEARSTEGWLIYIPWDLFRRKYLFGAGAAADTDKPAYITVDPQDKLVLHPVPDASYTIRGQYQKGPQTLSANNDEPEMPSQHHMAIVWRALMLMGTFDEAPNQMPAWGQFLAEHMNQLILKQTPRVQVGGPLA